MSLAKDASWLENMRSSGMLYMFFEQLALFGRAHNGPSRGPIFYTIMMDECPTPPLAEWISNDSPGYKRAKSYRRWYRWPRYCSALGPGECAGCEGMPERTAYSISGSTESLSSMVTSTRVILPVELTSHAKTVWSWSRGTWRRMVSSSRNVRSTPWQRSDLSPL